MKWSWFGRAAMALVSALALGLSMTACGGGTIAYLWVIGQQYNEINGFKVDDYTGNLTQVVGSPFAANGTNPVDILVKPGGRYVYVINQGSEASNLNPTTTNPADGTIALFSVGGNGALTYQASYQTQGFYHMWASFDSTGGYLFILDKYSQDYATSGKGAITTFAADPNTGRLTLVTQNASTPSGGLAPTFVDVGASPLMMSATTGCLFTLNQGDKSVTPYAYSGGQLSIATTGSITIPNTTNLTSINGNTQYMVLTDAGPTNPNGGFTSAGQILPYNVSSACGLTIFSGGAVPNDATVSNPVYSLLDAKSQYLYILNASTTSTAANQPYSNITGYTLSNGQLKELQLSPFKSGPGPVCMVEDPTSKYMYVSNHNDGSVTGYSYDNNEGTLSDLPRGSTFTTNNAGAQCLALSGSVD